LDGLTRLAHVNMKATEFVYSFRDGPTVDGILHHQLMSSLFHQQLIMRNSSSKYQVQPTISFIKQDFKGKHRNGSRTVMNKGTMELFSRFNHLA
jgi:hypothetical protein